MGIFRGVAKEERTWLYVPPAVVGEFLWIERLIIVKYNFTGILLCLHNFVFVCTYNLKSVCTFVFDFLVPQTRTENLCLDSLRPLIAPP